MGKYVILWLARGSLLLALASVSMQTCSGAEDSQSVSVVIAEYVDIDAEGVSTFGQGHTELGLPGAGNGADPDFSGGSDTDYWKPTPSLRRPYANGAVGRSQVTIRTNTDCTVEVYPLDVNLQLEGSQPGVVIPALCQLGKLDGGKWKIYQSWHLPYSGSGTNTDCWIYVLARRQGLSDPAGTYTATITLQATTD